MNRSASVLIVGAGLSGLAAALTLRQKGMDVLIVEKGRGVGGRMATRRIGEAVFDHGAQFMTVRDIEFARAVEKWSDSGLVTEWFRSGTGEGPREGHVRFRGTPSMTAVAKELARSADIRLSTRVSAIELVGGMDSPSGTRWLATTESGESHASDAVLLTSPVPQSLALLDAGRTRLPEDIRDELEKISYERCISVMALLEKSSSVPVPGWFAPVKGPISWIADNQVKGVSPVPAVTIHGGASFSEERWEDDRHHVGEDLLSAAGSLLGCEVKSFQVHGWRYSKPVRISGHRCLGTRDVAPVGADREPRVSEAARATPPVVFAGDAFGGPRVEGAFLSGLAAADYLLRELKW